MPITTTNPTTMHPKDRSRQRKAKQKRRNRSKHKSIVGFMEPMRDAFSDVRKSCNDWLRNRGLDEMPDFVYGSQDA